MKRLFSFYLTICKKTNRTFRFIFLFGITLSLILVVGSKHFWKERSVNTEIHPQKQVLTTLPKDTEPFQDEKKEEEEDDDDEEESADEDLASDAKSPWTLLESALPSRYYEPSVKKNRPFIVIFLTGLGLNKTWTEHILATVDKNVTLVFSPYSPNLTEQIQRSATLGYQAFVNFPMEPNAYPNPDPGPYTVLVGAKEEDNVQKTKLILEKIPRGTGLIGDHGSKFTASKVDLEPVLKEIKNHGSLFVDPNTTIRSQIKSTCKALDISCLQVDLTLPITANLSEKDDFIKKVIQNAKENGMVIVNVPAIPAFTNALPEWIETFGKHDVKLVTVAGLQTQEFSLDASRNN